MEYHNKNQIILLENKLNALKLQTRPVLTTNV